jgi:DNA-binding SARP family transcriptional activator
MDRLSLRVLGDFGVEGVDEHELGSRKARQMLRLLALARGQAVPTADLADALWGDSLPARPADQVSVLASRLRRVVGRERVEHVERGYRVHYDWLDADELESLSAEVSRRRDAGNRSGAAAAARMALALMRSDVPTDGDEPDWALEAVAELRALLRRGRRISALALLDAGNWLEAAELAEADLRQDPFDEDAVRLLMRANLAGGRPGVALTAYAALRDRLAEELGTDPAPETSELHVDVLRGVHRVRSVVPRQRAGFVGRRAQLAHLDSLVARAASGEVPMAVIVGEPGIGKTTLMSTWASSRADAGDTVLACICSDLDRSVPLDAVLVALAEHLQKLDRVAAEAVLGPEKSLLAPLLGLEPLGPGADHPLLLTEASSGPSLLHAALAAVLPRLSTGGTVIMTIDDAHLAGPALATWLGQLQRTRIGLVVVAARRVGEGETLPVRDVVELGPLDRAATGELVGEDRADALFARSLGHPLFLSELAATSSDELPRSLVDAIAARCDQLGDAGTVVRAAAVIGPPIDLDLLSTVLHRPAVAILESIETATHRGLLVEDAGEFAFRHDLVRSALAEGASSGRVTLLHREAGRALSSRTDADPLRVADHARRGGDLVLAARSLRAASARAADRFDQATAEALLDQSLDLHPDSETRLARARIRTLRGEYAEALDDVAASQASNVAALEVGAWASYFDRNFAQATQFAADGAVAAEGIVRTRCLMIGGRTQHARGDLDAAEALLVGALDAAAGIDRAAASAWLGVLRAHQSRVDEALQLLHPAASVVTGVEQTSATLHALLFTGHAQALAGRPAIALEQFDRYTSEVERRYVPRFAGRGVNFSGWVLRNIGESERAAELHHEALAEGDTDGKRELMIAALEDLAEDRHLAGDLAASSAHLDAAESQLHGDLVFGWRLAMKLSLLRSRLALDSGTPELALDLAQRLARDADRVGVPRYATVARLVVDRARHALGSSVDLAATDATLRRAHDAVRLEWWWAGEMGAALGVEDWVDRSEKWADELARQSAEYESALRKYADRRLAEWRINVR